MEGLISEHGPELTILRYHVDAISAGGAKPIAVAPPILLKVTLSAEFCH
jgi:hypothetical protein